MGAIILSFALLLALAFYLVNLANTKYLDNAINRTIESVHDFYQHEIKQETEQLTALLNLISTENKTIQYLAEGQRQQLQKKYSGLYNELHASHDISHFYFSNAERINLLRLHKPGKYGDKINRLTTIEAEKTKSLYSGLELGKFGELTLRVVKPVIINEEIIGFIELGKEITNTVKDIQETLGLKILVVIYKKYLHADDLNSIPPSDTNLPPSNSYDNFVVVQNAGSTGLNDLPKKFEHLQATDHKHHNQGENIYEITESFNGEPEVVFYFPITDATGATVGEFVIRSDYQQMQSVIYKVWDNYWIIISVLVMVLLAFIYWVLSNVHKTLKDYQLQNEEENNHLKQLSRELIQSETSLKRAQEIANLGNWELDISTNQLFWSDQVYNIFEVKPDTFEASFEQFIEAVHPDDRELVTETYRKSLVNKTPYSIEHRLLMQDGSIKHVQERGRNYYDAQGYALKSSGTILDITERKEAQLALEKQKITLEEVVRERTEDLENALDDANRANKAKSQFLANMSHEIRTPMNAIIGMSHLTLQTELNDKQKEFVRIVNYSAENLLRILNDILDFSKIEAGKLEIENINFSLSETVSSVIQLLQVAADKRNIQLVVNLTPGIPDLLIGDPVRLNQVITNLLGNAIKFSNKKDVVSLDISLIEETADGARLHFEVKDTGIGMSQEKQQRLFEAFIQGDTSTTREYGGTGLGLVISQRIVNMLGGNIVLESEEHVGSNFSFTIELKKQVNHAPDALTAIKKPLDPDTEYSHLHGKRLLLVEDNEINQELALELLQMQNIEADIAIHGKQALQMLEDKHYDGILMDCQMPVMDGYEATMQIRRIERFKELPILAMTANTMKGDREKVLEVGMNDHIPKPINPQQMFDTISKWIN